MEVEILNTCFPCSSIKSPYKIVTVNLRDFKNTEIPYIMSSHFTIGDIEDENINTDSEWRILTDGGLGCSFG